VPVTYSVVAERQGITIDLKGFVLVGGYGAADGQVPISGTEELWRTAMPVVPLGPQPAIDSHGTMFTTEVGKARWVQCFVPDTGP
jgi:hypothetical protein